jgi:hypothetical protein
MNDGESGSRRVHGRDRAAVGAYYEVQFFSKPSEASQGAGKVCRGERWSVRDEEQQPGPDARLRGSPPSTLTSIGSSSAAIPLDACRFDAE